MEDYAPLIWIVIVVGSMIASGVSKVRKQMRKDMRQPESTEPRSDQSPAPQGRMQPYLPHGMGHDAPRKVFTYDDELPDTTFTYETTESDETSEYEQVRPGTTDSNRHMRQGGISTYEKQAFTRIESTSAGSFGRQSSASGSPQTEDEVHDAIGTIEESTAPEQQDGGLAQEFDLRKAVIYSEILKPKFDA